MRIETTYHPDGSCDIVTIDDGSAPELFAARTAYTACINAAVEELRRRGEPRPVFVALADLDEAARRLNDRVAAGLAGAITFPHFVADWVRPHVATREVARRALEAAVGKEARRLFRSPSRPVGYWITQVFGHQVEVNEACSLAEARAARAASAR